MDEALERFGDLGITADEGPEDAAFEAARFDRLCRAYGRAARRVCEQADLPEGVAALEQAERDLFASLGALDDAGRAGDEDVEGVGFVALPHDHRPERERDRLEGIQHELPHLLGHRPERRQLLEGAKGVLRDDGLSHPRATPPARRRGGRPRGQPRLARPELARPRRRPWEPSSCGAARAGRHRCSGSARPRRPGSRR